MKFIDIGQIRRFCRNKDYRATCLRKLFKNEQIYIRNYGLGIFYNVILRSLVYLFALVALINILVILGYQVDWRSYSFGLYLIFFSLLLVVNIIRALHVRQIFKNRVWGLKISLPDKSPLAKLFAQTVICDEWDEDRKWLADRINLEFRLINEDIIPESTSYLQRTKEKLDYSFYDAIFSIYRRSRGFSHKNQEAYYTVFCAKLHQAVPHLVFDNKQAGGQQFRRIYLNSQKLSLDGNFDDYFATYSPEYHQIETLSFITPEVLWAMIELQDCDVEFLDNYLLCYAPLLRRDQLATFRQRCLDLHAKVNDNLSAYTGRSQKTVPFARRLLKNPLRYILLTLILGALFAYVVYLTVLDPTDGQSFFILAVLGLSVTYFVVKMIKEAQYNRRLKARFLNHRR